METIIDLANFRSRVIAELEAATYPDYIGETPKEVAEDVSQYLRFVIAAQMEEGASASLGGSRIGGHPDLPEGLAWPVEGDDEDLEPLAFLCQINLADVHPHDLEGVMLASGMLWFFSIADGDRAYIDDSTTKVLYQKDAGALVRREAPADTEVISEFQLAFGPSFLLEEEEDGVLGLMRFDSAIETAVDTAIQGSGGKVGSLRMLGPPSSEILVLAGAIQPDGKSLICGNRRGATLGRSDLVVARLNPDGSPDPTFGSDPTMAGRAYFQVPADAPNGLCWTLKVLAG